MSEETCPRCDPTSLPPWKMCAEHENGLYTLRYYYDHEWQECRVCGIEFRYRPYSTATIPARFVCSPRCARDLANAQARARRAAAGANSMKRCAWCGKSFGPSRSDARYCGVRCRVAAYRASL